MPAHEPVRRTQSGDAAVRGWRADRTRGLRSERVRDEAAGDRGAGTARRAAGPALGVPGIAARTLERRAGVPIAATAGELDHRELRREDRAGAPQLRDRRRVHVDDLIAIRRRPPGRRRACGCEEILRSVRDPEQRTALAAPECRVRALRLRKRALARDGRDRVVARTDARETGAGLLGKLHGRYPAPPERVPKLGDGRIAMIAQGRYTVGGSVAIGTRCLRNSVAFFSTVAFASSASREGSSTGRVSSCFGVGADSLFRVFSFTESAG